MLVCEEGGLYGQFVQHNRNLTRLILKIFFSLVIKTLIGQKTSYVWFSVLNLVYFISLF